MVAAWYCVFSANSGILADPDLQKLRLYESPYVFYAGRWEGGKRGGEGRFGIYQCCRSVKLLKSYKKIEKPNIYFLMDYLNTFFHSIICLPADLRSRCPRALSIQPKFPGWGSKFSWGQMDRDRSGRSRSIPLSKRVSRSFKMEDVG